MIDEWAFHLAQQAWLKHRGRVDDGLRVLIEAYEAACWRPIEEAITQVECCSTVILILLTDTRNEWYTASLDDEGEWCFDDHDGGFEIPHQELVERGAMFRTITPPPTAKP